MDAHVHIVTNRQHGTLSIGVTSDIARRAWQHREGAIEGFTAKHGLKRLIFVERQETSATAIRREKTLKTKRRA